MRKIVYLFAICFLVGCGGKDSYVSVDRSADYTSAQSRPPLRKPDSQPITSVPSSIARVDTSLTGLIEPALLDGEDVRLQLNTDMDQSWAFLASKLIGQGITVFERNETARYFVVACSDVGVLEDSAQVEPVKENRWVIFSKEVEKESENCSIRLSQQKEFVVAVVYNQYGQVINTERARQLFVKLAS